MNIDKLVIYVYNVNRKYAFTRAGINIHRETKGVDMGSCDGYEEMLDALTDRVMKHRERFVLSGGLEKEVTPQQIKYSMQEFLRVLASCTDIDRHSLRASLKEDILLLLSTHIIVATQRSRNR